MDNYLITWFYAEKKDDESFYPSVGGNTSSPEYQKVYWRCVYDFFRTAQLTQTVSNVKYLFFTNVPNIPTDIDGFNLAQFFGQAGVKVERLELTNRTPKDWYGAWRNQFYLFDVLSYLKNHDVGNFLILDSDIFITQDLLPVYQEIEQNQMIAYDCGYGEDVSINGISINQMRTLYSKFSGGGCDSKLRYKGGELIGVTSGLIPEILDCYSKLWKFNYELYQKKEMKLNEEAHFLSVIYHHLDFDESLANKYIKRMWTAVKCDNVVSGDEKLALWHLPAEKKYAFETMFTFLQEDCSKTQYNLYLRGLLHIPGNKMIRKMRKTMIRIQEKIREKV